MALDKINKNDNYPKKKKNAGRVRIDPMVFESAATLWFIYGSFKSFCSNFTK